MLISSKQFALGAGIFVGTLALMGFVPRLREKTQGFVAQKPVANFARLGLGIWGIWASSDRRQAEIFNKTLVALYGSFALMGLFPRFRDFVGVPLHGSSLWLHAGGALAAAFEEDLLPAPSIEMLRKVYAEA
jgi:hypothetical protein